MKRDVRQVCLNGHTITVDARTKPQTKAKFCADCGQPTITTCISCEESIRGYDSDRDAVNSWDPPNHCHNCGMSYPWTAKKIEALTEVIDELDELDPYEKEKLKRSIPDIVADTPKSEIAVTRFKKAITKLGKLGQSLLASTLKNIATSAVKNMLGLG